MDCDNWDEQRHTYLSGWDEGISSSVSSPDSTPSASQAVLVVNGGREDMAGRGTEEREDGARSHVVTFLSLWIPRARSFVARC